VTGKPLHYAEPATRFEARPRIDPRWTRLLWPLLALVVLLAFDLIYIRGFFQIQVRDARLYGSLIDILDRATPVLLLSVGMTLVIATGGVDLSVGAIMAISGAVAAQLVAGHGPAVAMAAALLVSILGGAWNGFLVAALGIQPIVATLILMVAGRGIAQLITGGQIITFTNPAFDFVASGALSDLLPDRWRQAAPALWGVALGYPFTIPLALLVACLTGLVARKTAIGLFIEAVGGNATASRYAGVNAGVVKFMAYVFSGLCAGIAGLIVASDIRAADPNNAGLYLELDAILAVVIGGTALTGGRFSLPGSVLGALVIQALTTTILTLGVKAQWTLVVKALVVVIVCLLQSEGLRDKITGVLRRSRGGRRGFEPVLGAPATTPPTVPSPEPGEP
jgi:simple sugar transport system permease protein